MSMVTTRTTTIVRHEYLVPRSGPWGELGKAIAMAQQALKDAGKNPYSDDAALVDSDDENIIIYWERQQSS